METACLGCDLPVSLGRLEPGERAACPRCGNLLSARVDDPLVRAMALALGSAVLLLLANTFPFLELKASGLESEMTLPSSAVQLYRDGFATIAVVVLATIVVIPAGMLGLILTLAGALRRGVRAAWLVPAGRLLFWLRSWSMAEVFVIGTIVSLVKIGQMATVILGAAFWCYIAFSVCFTAAVASLDRLETWERIEEAVA